MYLTRDLERATAARRLTSAPAPRALPADLYRDGDHYVLALEMPGVDPGSIDVGVDGRLLTVSARRTARTGESVEWIARERGTGELSRRFTLGRSIDTEQISADYRDGVLSVVIPVAETAKPRKVAVVGAPAAPAEAATDVASSHAGAAAAETAAE
ncbi:hypothetical protein GCM10027515_16490 [Schumannella luteola]|uniref:HSP20 family protein n=1 Tax=Schumannella luteola TaxID=472059 RepID=A0A852YHC6_9MICO|nr:Hsp20/alpha crystallin family protein [Schumannella luteola]NYH00552.1 HSP20 family protein [Schumannella luteola]TPW91023.1 Hsp20/alpha crystallin family protein [Schumannella luteola]